MKINRVIIIQGTSQYDIFNDFNNMLADGFRRMGVNAECVNPLEVSDAMLVNLMLNADLMISFNGVGLNIYEPLREIIDGYSIPCLSIMVDHPYNQHTRLIDARFNQIYSVVDRKHLEYVNKYYPGIKHKFFLPHGGMQGKTSGIAFDKKKYDISFFGSYVNPNESLKKFGDYPENIQELFIKAVEDVWTGKILLLEDSVYHYLKTNNLTREDNFPEIMFGIHFLDDYIRNEKRELLIRTALKSGYNVHVFGNGWENMECDADNLILHGNVDYRDALDIMADSKIVLNNMPNFLDGSHERIFSVMASGSLCITDGNPYLREQLTDGEDILYYKWSNIEELPVLIDKILSGQMDVSSIIKNGQEKVLSAHMWADRAKEILAYCKDLDMEKAICDCPRPVDYGMNSLMEFVNRTDIDTLYAHIKGRYECMSLYEKDYVNLLYDSMNRYKFWGTWEPGNNDYGIIEERVDVLKNHSKELVWLYDALEDYSSKRVLYNILMNWISFSTKHLEDLNNGPYKHYFDHDIITLSDDEVFVDLGAYIGDTAEEFMLETSFKFKKIYCYEFSKRNVEELKNISEIDERVIIRPYAIGDKNGSIMVDINDDSSSDRIMEVQEQSGATEEVRMVSLDEDIKDKVTFIKSDVEGAEMAALKGAQGHIRNEHPKLAISIYHGNYDIFRVAKYIYELDDTYRFYMRYYGGNLYPNEIVLYAV